MEERFCISINKVERPSLSREKKVTGLMIDVLPMKKLVGLCPNI